MRNACHGYPEGCLRSLIYTGSQEREQSIFPQTVIFEIRPQNDWDVHQGRNNLFVFVAKHFAMALGKDDATIYCPSSRGTSATHRAKSWT